MLAFSAISILGVDNLSCQTLDQGEWSLYPDVFSQICLCWATLAVDLLFTHLNRKVSSFVVRARHLLADVTDALAASWSHCQPIYAFLKHLPRLLCTIEAERDPGHSYSSRLVSVTLIRRHCAVGCRRPLATSSAQKSSVPRVDLPLCFCWLCY